MAVMTHFGVRAKIHQDYGEEPIFLGLATEGYKSAYPELEGATDVIAVNIHRTLKRSGGGGQPGSVMIVLPGHTHPQSKKPWSQIIKLRDVVEVEAKVHRYPDMSGDDSMSDPWRNHFFGFVEKISKDTIQQDGGFVEVIYLQVTDSMGVLSTTHFNYWRNLGAVLQGKVGGDMFQKLFDLDKAGFDRIAAYSSTIAQATEVIFQSFIYSRFALSRPLYVNNGGTDGPFNPQFYVKNNLEWDQMHGYRFESDDFQVAVDIAQLAPQGGTWMEAASWAIDAPVFYEFYMDNLPREEVSKRSLKNGGTNDLGRSISLASRVPSLVLRGDRVETFCVRPAPFPIYDPERGGYSSTAWDSLPIRHCAPSGPLSIKTSVSAENMYSVFSVDATSVILPSVNNASQSDTQAQMVVDIERYAKRVGYRGLDLQTRRQNIYAEGTSRGGQSITLPELARRLCWQSFSYNHFNDIFEEGPIHIPLDLKMQLGIRFVCERMMYYVEEYTHNFDASGCDTTLEVSRGLSLAKYGYHGLLLNNIGLSPDVPNWTEAHDDLDYVSRYLGRKRPNEEFEPTAGQDILESQKGKMGFPNP